MNCVNTAHRKSERGITIVLVAFSLLALLGMAALAIDVSTLYVAHGEAQRAADAAALAGARMFAASGYTSVSTPLPSTPLAFDVCLSSAAPGADAAANRQAEKTAAQNLVAGQPAAVQSIVCNTTAANPQITVTVHRTGLPTFFGRIWGGTANTVTATAVAEAYNPSGSGVPIQVQGIKPWLVPDCDPSPANAGPPKDCVNGGYFVDPNTTTISNNGSFVGETITLTPATLGGTPPNSTASPRTLNYYPLNTPMRPPDPACPSTAGSCAQVGSDPYHDNIACYSTAQFSCGQQVGLGQVVTIDTSPAAVVNPLTDQGTQCLIHATGPGPGTDQDQLTALGTLPDGTPPVTIKGGNSNPNPALQGASSISRSDSIVTLPIYHNLGGPNTDLCPGGAPCSGTGTIIGFLQLGIQENSAPGQVKGVIMNVAGCNVVGPGVSGGGVSPIPVRLIHQ